MNSLSTVNAHLFSRSLIDSVGRQSHRRFGLRHFVTKMQLVTLCARDDPPAGMLPCLQRCKEIIDETFLQRIRAHDLICGAVGQRCTRVRFRRILLIVQQLYQYFETLLLL